MSDLISRDDAIRELSGVCSTWEDDAKVQEIVMAIPSAKPIGDLISRADAIEAVGKLLVDGQTAKVDGKFVPLHFALMNTLSALPSAETPTTDEKHQLSSETPTNAPTDLISRAEAMGAVQDHFNANGFKGYDDGQKMMDRIKALPSAEAVQGDGKMIPIELKKRYPHSRDEDITDAFMRGYQAHAEAVQGEWIRTVDGNGWNEWGVLTCPLCGASIEDKYYHSWKYNFCPNCGARMKGGDTECL